jgi:DNA-binding transcriptional LysR family regulator
MVSFVAQGVGVAVAPEGMVPTLPRGVVFRPLAGEPVVLVSGIAWNPHELSAALAAVLAVARDVLPTPEAARDHVRPQHNE